MLSSSIVLSLAILSAASPAPQKRAISCLRVRQSATATWTNCAGKACTFVGVVGSNYGDNPSGSGGYVQIPSTPCYLKLTCPVTPAMVDIVPDAVDLLLVMSTRKTASLMISVHTLTVQAAAAGLLDMPDCEDE